MKIDVEGYESKAFDEAGKYLNNLFIDCVQFEYEVANLDSHTSLIEKYGSLNDKGYRVKKVMPHGLDFRTCSPYEDNHNYANYVVISSAVCEH